MSPKSRPATFAPTVFALSLALVALGACGKDEAPAAKGEEAAKSEPAAEKAPAGEQAGGQGDAGEGGNDAPGETGKTEPGDGDSGSDEDEDTQGEAAPPLPEAFDQLGVAICDQYVSDYVACIGDKVPEAEREAQRRIVFDNLRSWQQIKKGSDAAAQSLQTGCKIAREQAKRATQQWGCTW